MIKKLFKKIFLIILTANVCLLLTACLRTRDDVQEVEQKKVLQDNLISLQRSNADISSRFSEIEVDIRQLNGKTEVLENQIEKLSREKDKSIQATNELVADGNKRNLALQEEITKLSQQITTMQAELDALKLKQEASISSKTAHGGSKDDKKDFFAIAEEQFKAQDFKKAAMSFQKYRETQKKGKKLAEATYKIGLCFQELDMKDDAKTFFEEVITKYPNAPEAKKAKQKLKSFK